MNSLYAQEILKVPSKQLLTSTENIGTIEIEKELADTVDDELKASLKEFNLVHSSISNSGSDDKYGQPSVVREFEVRDIHL